MQLFCRVHLCFCNDGNALCPSEGIPAGDTPGAGVPPLTHLQLRLMVGLVLSEGAPLSFYKTEN